MEPSQLAVAPTEQLGHRAIVFLIGFLVLIASSDPVAASSALFASPARTFPTGAAPVSIAVGDLNSDGTPDFITANSDANSATVYFGNGDGSFGGRNDLATYLHPSSVIIADLNGSGPDVVVTARDSHAATMYFNMGGGVLFPGWSAYPNYLPLDVAAGDVNRDGSMDLVTAHYSATMLYFLPGDGTGRFTRSTGFGMGAGPSSILLEDLNRDSTLDIVVTNSLFERVYVFLGDGTGTFGEQREFLTGDAPTTLETGDFNRDGNPDLVSANFHSNSVSVLLGNGDGTFRPRADFATGSSPDGVCVADFDLDGFSDLAVTNFYSNTISILTGLGDGTFSSRSDIPTLVFPEAISSADFNSDGRPDLALTNRMANVVSVFLNTGADFPTPTLISLFMANPTPSGIRVEWTFGGTQAFATFQLERALATETEWLAVAEEAVTEANVSVVLDASTPPEEGVRYRLRCIDRDGREHVFGPIGLATRPLTLTTGFGLISPNPSTARSSINFSLAANSHVTLTLTDLQGRTISTLINDERPGGRYVAPLDASALSPGIYFVNLRTSEANVTRRFVVAR